MSLLPADFIQPEPANNFAQHINLDGTGLRYFSAIYC